MAVAAAAVIVPMAGRIALQALLGGEDERRTPAVRSRILQRSVVGLTALGVVIFCVIVAAAMPH